MANGSGAARRAAPPALPLLGLALVAVTDALARVRSHSRPVAGLLDETAHVGTGLLVLGAMAPRRTEFALGVLAGSVLIDVDHIPDVLGSRILRGGRMRPLPHSIATLLALRLAQRPGNAARRGVLIGVTAHLARDLATGTNSVPLFWPLSRRPASVPYGLYAAGLTALAGLGLAQRRTRFGASMPRVAPRKSTTDGADAST
jgi:membrane-bound metal-dependent hydrolase YbcI (DUF457 family)